MSNTDPRVVEVEGCATCVFADWDELHLGGNCGYCTHPDTVDLIRIPVPMTVFVSPESCPLRHAPLLVRLRGAK